MSPGHRAHDGVADPGAEKVRFDEFIALVHTEGIQQGEKEKPEGEKYHEPALFLIIEINHEQASFLCWEFLFSVADNPSMINATPMRMNERRQDDQVE
jgi:hypothetical protein